LVEQADAALYVSKRAGRDRTTHHDDPPEIWTPAREPKEILGC
jgi:hypothetical protein